VKGKDLTSLIIVAAISVVVFWLVNQRLRKAQALGVPAADEMTEYERLHTTVPITASTERLFEVYGEE